MIANHVGRVLGVRSGADAALEREAQLLETLAHEFDSILTQANLVAFVSETRNIFIRLAVTGVFTYNITDPIVLSNVPKALILGLRDETVKDPKNYVRFYLSAQLSLRAKLLRDGARIVRMVKGKPMDYESASLIMRAWQHGMAGGANAAMARSRLEAEWPGQLRKSLKTAASQILNHLKPAPGFSEPAELLASLMKLDDLFKLVPEYAEYRRAEEKDKAFCQNVIDQNRRFAEASARLAAVQ